MSDWGKVPREAFTDDRLTRRDLRVFGVICNHADGRTGICTVKQATVAEEIGSDRVGVLRSLKKLVDLGYLSAHQRAGMRRSLQYRVLIADRAAGQMSLFDSEAAPRQARSRPAKGGRKATSDVAPEATSKEQTPVNRSRAASLAKPVGIEPAVFRSRSGAPGTPTMADAASRAGEWVAANDAEPIGYAELGERLRRAAGDGINTASPAFIVLTEPYGWLAAGCDLEADILPTIAGLAARAIGSPIRSWRYFTPAVLEARDRRLAAGRPAVLTGVRPRDGPTACDTGAVTTVVPFDARGARHEADRQAEEPRPGRFAAAAARRRRDLAGGEAGRAPDED